MYRAIPEATSKAESVWVLARVTMPDLEIQRGSTNEPRATITLA